MRNDTVIVHSWQDMVQFGINPLTGESCAFAMRLLCDLNEDGAGLMMDYLGVAMLRENWNSTVNDKPAVASVMLHRGSLLEVAEFAMLRSQPLALVYRGGEGIMAIYDTERLVSYRKLIEDWPETTGKWTMRTIGRTALPSVGSRNIHAASGRIE